MKNPRSRFINVFEQRSARRNARELFRILSFVLLIVGAYTLIFQLLMTHVENQHYSFWTGFYWTLSTMSTLGMGDVAFSTDIGRMYTILVLMSGIILFLIVLPFAFIRFFYAPWLETRRLPDKISGHVILTNHANLGPELIDRLELYGIPAYIVESDTVRAGNLRDDGLSVLTGDNDDPVTYERLRTDRARLVLANGNDAENTNIALTVRSVAPLTPIVAVAENEVSIEVLGLAGATQVLPLKQTLGEKLANRVNAGHAQTHVIGSFHDLLIAEFPVHNTPFAGRPIKDLPVDDASGLHVAGLLEQTQFLFPDPERVLTEHSVLIVLGTREEMDRLDEILVIFDANYNPALIIGGGKVGLAAARMLRKRGGGVHMIEKNRRLRELIEGVPDRLFIGDAMDHDVLYEAGLLEAPSVLLTTNDDAANIFLTILCRRLAPDIRIVSRISQEKNAASIRRAGADLILNHISLGVEAVFAMLRGRKHVVLGEGAELYEVPLPGRLAGLSIDEAGIHARSGLDVIAIKEADRLIAAPRGDVRLERGAALLLVGNHLKMEGFHAAFR